MQNTTVALFVAFGLISEREGELLAQKIRQGTLPYDFKTSLKQVRAWIEEAKQNKL